MAVFEAPLIAAEASAHQCPRALASMSLSRRIRRHRTGRIPADGAALDGGTAPKPECLCMVLWPFRWCKDNNLWLNPYRPRKKTFRNCRNHPAYLPQYSCLPPATILSPSCNNPAPRPQQSCTPAATIPHPDRNIPVPQLQQSRTPTAIFLSPCRQKRPQLRQYSSTHAAQFLSPCGIIPLSLRRNSF